MPDNVNHPSHYNTGSLEVIDAIEGLDLGFHAGNNVKYAWPDISTRTGIEDLRKAAWYLNRLIELEMKLKKTGGNIMQFKSTVDVSVIQSMGGDHMVVAAAKVSTSGLASQCFRSPGMRQ